METFFKDFKRKQNPKSGLLIPQVLRKWINNSLKTSDIPNPFKLAEITAIHKKEHPFDKDNYRPISILFLISKALKKLYTVKFIAASSSIEIIALRIPTG